MKELSYSRIHGILRDKYGKANHCENPDCSGKYSKYEWSHIHGAPMFPTKDCYIQLCVSCHRKYDMTEEVKEKRRKARIGGPGYMKGRKHSGETKKKMSIVHKGNKACTGMIFSNEWKKNLGIANLGNNNGFQKKYDLERITCEHCGSSVAPSTYKRFHEKYCKYQ